MVIYSLHSWMRSSLCGVLLLRNLIRSYDNLRQGVTTMRVSIISYDVWGNGKEGYEVNAAHVWNYGVEFNLDWDSGRDIAKFLKSVGFLAKHVKVSNLEFDGHVDYVTITRSRDAYPLCEVRID